MTDDTYFNEMHESANITYTPDIALDVKSYHANDTREILITNALDLKSYLSTDDF